MIRIHSLFAGIASTVSLFLFAFLIFFAPLTARADSVKGNLPPEVQKAVTKLLAMKNPAASLPEKAELEAFLDYTTSPINLKGVGDADPFPARIGKASGVLWRSRIKAPLATTLEYLYNPKVPTGVVYPASIRYAKWLPGSDILTLPTPLWKQLDQHKDKPLVLRGTELEEITPDTNSGAYYKYTLDRVLILTEYQGQKMLISVTLQKGNSETGKKAAILGDYSNWDFVYSGVKGTTASGIGWAETYIYNSASIIVFYEDAPGGKETGYAMYRWMEAGWSGMNMVKGHHITAGAERSFAGIKAFMESPKRPSPDSIAKYVASLNAMDLPTLQARFAPYSAKVEEAAAKSAVLKTDDFQNVIKDGAYGKSLTKDEIVAAFSVNFVKEKLGKSLLAGPLNGEAAAHAAR